MNNIAIIEDQVMWYPGIYEGRKGAYAQKVEDISLVELTRLVKDRAKEDGEWAIKEGLVGDNEDAMRKMMEWVSRDENILQCVSAIHQAGMASERTVDFVCRDLANGSKYVAGTRG